MTAAERAIAYSPSSVLGGEIGSILEAQHQMSASVYNSLKGIATVHYGTSKSQSVDIVVPKTTSSAPLIIFFHGGYWQELSKSDVFFLAPAATELGYAFASVDYSLAPYATLGDIVSECQSAVHFVLEKSNTLGIDPKRVILCGHSAGAQLAAMVCCLIDPEFRPIGALLLSGIYDLEPLIGTYINDALSLDSLSAHANSPINQDLSRFPRTLLAYGQYETDEFKRQSNAMAAAVEAGSVSAPTLELPECNHFDLLENVLRNATISNWLAECI